MSPSFIFLAAGSIYIIWGLALAARWYTTRKLQAEVYQKYNKDGTLKPSVSPDAFADIFMRCEGPRLGLHLFAGAVASPFAIMIGLRIFNFIWDAVWDVTGQLGWFEVGELPHSLMTVFLCVGVLFCVAWVAMRRYHLTRPMKLRNEIRKLNGEKV